MYCIVKTGNLASKAAFCPTLFNARVELPAVMAAICMGIVLYRVGTGSRVTSPQFCMPVSTPQYHRRGYYVD